MIRIALLLALLLFLASCASAPVWRDVPTQYDLQAIEHNQRVCAERGLAWDMRTGGCKR